MARRQHPHREPVAAVLVAVAVKHNVILVDPSHWWFRDKKWCHLVSDNNLEELHAFAAQLGVPHRGFQGDHYDIPDDYRTQAIELGATAVASRELLQRLKAAGLRFSPAQRRAWGTTTRPDLATAQVEN